MNREHIRLFGLLVFLATVAVARISASANLDDPYTPEIVLGVQDTIPLEERYGDFLTDPSSNPFDLKDPSIIEQNVEYDPETGYYMISERIGDDFYRMPSYMTFEEYMDYQAAQQERAYFQQLLGVNGVDAGLRVDPIAKFDIKNSLVDRLFGGSTVDIRPQGSIDLTFGVDFQNVENPALLERQRRQGGFDFDMAIQTDVQGSIGEKLNLSFNYNTQATFDFENPMKLDYNADKFTEDEIIKKIEAGNVSLPLRGSLIQGNQSLFGIKTELQFGRLRLTGLVAQQNSEREQITLEGGSQLQEFEVRANEYDENRHFFLSHYNRDVFEEALENLPQIKTLFRIEKIQVWITNDRREFNNVREIVAVADLGEPSRNRMTDPNPAIQPPLLPKYRDLTGQHGLPDNNANPIYSLLQADPRTELVDKVVSELRTPPFSFQQARDFEKVTARQLSPSEFTYHPELGIISVNINVNPDQVLGVAYQYSYKDSTYQVGQFADDVPQTGDSIQNQKILFVKMLKSTTQRVDVPAWDLMMKNVYSIGAFNVNQQDFKLDIYYEEPAGGEKRFLPDTDIKGKPLLNVFNLDKLNTQGDPQPDGVFDFVPGVTINPQNGRIMFPVLEPFGSSLAKQLPNQLDSARYVYQQLYDSTKIRAIEVAYLNRFVIRGSYKSSVSNEISLGAFNIPPGSVRVTAGGQQLEEGRDYEIDYNIGRVRILNDALLASGAPIRVSFEDNTLFGFQRKTMLGLRADYTVNKNLTIGGTFLHLFERPFTPKVNIGDDPINNRIYGLDVNYSKEVPWVTRLIDKLPLYSTKEKSNLAFSAETAFLRPGHARAINEDSDQNKGGVVYIDDFEGSIAAIPLHIQPNQWVLSSVPQNDERNSNPYFPESAEENTVLSGVNRAHLTWYRIDDAVRGSSVENPYTRRIPTREVFRNFSNPSLNPLLNTLQTLDLTYYPTQRGSYNFDVPQGTAYSAGLNADGTLKNPETRWAGIMRAINTNDFQAANVEFIEFWLLSPFLDPDGSGNAIPNPTEYEGDIYFNLGNISEDILRDSRKFFENGLPDPTDENPNEIVVETQWGRVPITPQITNSFDADPARRAAQDVGLDGLNDEQEREFFDSYLQQIQQGVLSGPIRDSILSDPSFDNYIYYNNKDVFGSDPDVLKRYFRYNNTQGNTPSATEAGGNNTVTFGRTQPDMEDINNDLTLNETESYFQYRVPIKWDGNRGIDMRNEFVTDSVMDAEQKRIWYRFKVPLDLPSDDPNFTRVGGIQDFRAIRFIRMYLKGFEAQTTLRFARLDLVRNQWRRYLLPDGPTSVQGPVEEGDALFDVNDVNIEENTSRQPFGYILPPGITRERAIGVNQNAQQNEAALSMNVCNLRDGQEKSIYKLVDLDLRLYKGLKMFMHGEAKPSDSELLDGDLTVFVRIGSDFSRNYYEYELPLKLSDLANILPYNHPDYPRSVWPEQNDFDISFEIFKKLKLDRNNSGVDPGALYPLNGYEDPLRPGAKVRIKGNPSLGDVKGVMIGIRNPADDNQPHCAEVWVNEMRVFGLDERGGAAALARLDLQLADLGNLSVSGSYSSIGFGALDQQLLDRARENVVSYDVSTNLELGKFLPQNWGVRVPFYAQVSQTISTPQFDPYDLDLTLPEKLAEAPASTHDSIRTQAQDVMTIRSFNFTNVRKEPLSRDRTPLPWDISNFGVSYSRSITERRDPIIESDRLTRHQGSLDYGFSRKVTYITPVKWLIKKEIKAIQLLTEFNFNPLPNSFSFSTLMDRQLNQTQYRFTGGDPQYTTFYNKRWTWDRTYNLQWDLTKSLKFNFNAVNFAVIDEPDGLLDTETKRQQVWNNIQNFGRNKSYNHNLSLNYTLPFKLIPFLDWVNARATYSATYSWNAAALNTVSLGNVIQNTQARTVNADLDFEKLYNKWNFLKQVNTKSRPSTGRSGSDRSGSGGGAGRDNSGGGGKSKSKGGGGVSGGMDAAGGKNAPASAEDSGGAPGMPGQPSRGGGGVDRGGADRGGLGDERGGGSDRGGKDKKKEGVSPVVKAIVRPLLLVRKARLSYSENFGTVVPGFTPETEFLGLANNLTAPGWDFVVGGQPNFRQENYYSQSDWLYRNWNWISGDQLLNQPVTQDYSQVVDGQLSIEPFTDFRIDITANRNYSNFHSEYFRRDTIFDNEFTRYQDEFQHLIPKDVGSFTISYFTLNTLFTDKVEDLIALFNQFENNRVVIANRLGTGIHPDSTQAIEGYPYGYGRVQQSVLIPAFISAYSGQDPNQIPVSTDYTSVLKTMLPRLNWNLTYNGLSKLPMFKDILSNFSLRHGYKSTLTVNDFQTDLLFSPDAPGRLNPETGDYYSRFEIPSIVISEQLSPLIGIDIRTKNNISLRVDMKKSRNLQLSFLDNGLNETKASEYVVGFGYRMKEVQLPFLKKFQNSKQKDDSLTPSSGGRQNLGRGGGGSSPRNNGDLDISFDFSLRDDVTTRYLLDQPVSEPTRGTRAVSISPAAEYQVNKQLALRLFFDYRRTVPKISQSFPITNTSAGIVVRFTLN
ncbi:MAG: cell surface protein SprA [Lewinellaceae bacterium]|nr:cell surface protein SprA [Lewinellaceae bacterium]